MTTSSLEAPVQDRTKELEEENDLLLQQLHYVQEELEKYYLRNKELEAGGYASQQDLRASASITWVDDDQVKLTAEHLRLEARAAAQAKIAAAYAQNALNVHVGNMLIKAAQSPATLPVVLLRIHKIWRESTRKKPPAALGRKDFKKVIEVHGKDGFDAVEKLLTQVNPSSMVRADAYRALSKYQAQMNSTVAVEAARRSFDVDPRAYRQKWLAYMLYDAGQLLEAEAIMDLMPADHQLTDWDQRQRDSIKAAAGRFRTEEAKKRLKFNNNRAQIEKQIQALRQQVDAEKASARDWRQQFDKLGADLESARAKIATLNQEKADLQTQLSEAKKHSEALAAEKTRLQDQLAELDALKRNLETQAQELQSVKAAGQKIEQEKAALQGQLAEMKKHSDAVVAERKLLQDKLAELDALKKKLETQAQELQSVKGTAQKTEQEKTTLIGQLAEVKKLADERGKEIEDLKRKINSRLEAEKELEARQKLMNEEVLRAEAQIDLIRDMLLRDPGL